MINDWRSVCTLANLPTLTMLTRYLFSVQKCFRFSMEIFEKKSE